MGMENGPGPGREEIAKMEKINFNQEEPKADEALKKEINQGQEKEPVPKLELPEEPEMVKGLQDMLAEYKKHVEKKWGEVTHLWNPVSAYETSIIAVLEKLLALSTKKITVVTDPEKIRPLDKPFICADNSKVSALGWQPQIPIEETLSQVLAYWREEMV